MQLRSGLIVEYPPVMVTSACQTDSAPLDEPQEHQELQEPQELQECVPDIPIRQSHTSSRIQSSLAILTCPIFFLFYVVASSYV